jgi:hypothetical protein
MTVRRYHVHLFGFRWLAGGVHGHAEALVQRGGSWEHSKTARLTMNTGANLLDCEQRFYISDVHGKMDVSVDTCAYRN